MRITSMRFSVNRLLVTSSVDQFFACLVIIYPLFRGLYFSLRIPCRHLASRLVAGLVSFLSIMVLHGKGSFFNAPSGWRICEDTAGL